MQILLYLYCLPQYFEKTNLSLNKLLSHNVLSNEHLYVQICMYNNPLQDPSYKINHTLFNEIITRNNKKINVRFYDSEYGECIHALNNYSSNNIYIFINSNNIPTPEAILDIKKYFYDAINLENIITQNILINQINIGNSYYAATDTVMKHFNLFCEYIFIHNYECLFNFNTVFSFYLHISNYKLNQLPLHFIEIYHKIEHNNIYIQDIDRQLFLLNNIDYNEYNFNISQPEDNIKIKNNITYNFKKLNTIPASMINLPTSNNKVKVFACDGFYKTPKLIRELAISTNFSVSSSDNLYISHLAQTQSNSLFNSISSIFNQINIKIDSIISNFFAYSTQEIIHYNNENNENIWYGIIFLNPNSSNPSSVKFYTTTTGINKYNKNNSGINTNNLIIEDAIGNVFNRIILFDSQYFYSLPYTQANLFQFIKIKLA
jgi:hypothetical protein